MMAQPEPFTEQPMTGGRDPQSRSMFAGVAFIFILVVAVGIALVLFLHFRWTGRIDTCRAAYRDLPGLTIVQEDDLPLWQVQGSAVTVFETTETADVVEENMNRHFANLMREGVVSGDLRNVPTRNWTIESINNGARVTVTCE